MLAEVVHPGSRRSDVSEVQTDTHLWAKADLVWKTDIVTGAWSCPQSAHKTATWTLLLYILNIATHFAARNTHHHGHPTPLDPAYRGCWRGHCSFTQHCHLPRRYRQPVLGAQQQCHQAHVGASRRRDAAGVLFFWLGYRVARQLFLVRAHQEPGGQDYRYGSRTVSLPKRG